MADRAPQASEASEAPKTAAVADKSPSPKSSPQPSSPISPTQAQQIGGGTNVGILPAEHWTTQVHNYDDADADADSTLGSEAGSSTASITSSILAYRTIYGRTYHSERGNALYWALNDERHSEAMDIVHHVITISTDGKLFFAPVSKDITKVLDIGTGTGIWAIDFADEFPNTEVIGTDISPIQPSWVPPNVKFEIEDCAGPWTFSARSIDYVHMRWMLGSIPDWDDLFRQAYRTLKPGGWLESLEPSPYMESDDGSILDTDAMGQWGKIFVEGGRTIGRPFTVVPDGLQRKAMETAGFVDIHEVNFKTPIGGWPKDPNQKEIGRYAQLASEQDTEGYIMLIANTLGWRREEILVYVAQLRREIRSGKYHGFYRQKVVWGRKPE
ncbi:S-adenosyl-L-methionine-dependent methyltransferase [Bombardia bombarda]|uniref:S-adenosyl-L-methionine-dependent methyltransferase n=1 Tax=Bombardia bombarda TaxID=252184 RepID=A0AA40C8R9_9PEZI|nr:S-adenosyl-L-methionine-dependent methyltransferase [Bombardia bombarda]